MSHQYDRLGFPCRFVAAHARRVRRHSCHGNADSVWPPLEEGDNRSDGNVTLHDVAINQSRMTRSSIRWNTDICLERSKAPILLNLDIRSVVL